jgi:hypothetical protein
MEINEGEKMGGTCVTGYGTEKQVQEKEYRNRPRVAQRFPGGLGSQIFMKFGI